MIITKNTAIKKIKSGDAFLSGRVASEDGDYWIIDDYSVSRTHHVLCSDAPDLDTVEGEYVFVFYNDDPDNDLTYAFGTPNQAARYCKFLNMGSRDFYQFTNLPSNRSEFNSDELIILSDFCFISKFPHDAN